MNSKRGLFSHGFVLPLSFNTLIICVTILLIFTLGEPDLLDAITKFILSHAK